MDDTSRLIAQLGNRNTITVSSAHYNLPSIASQGEEQCKDSLRSKIELTRRICKKEASETFDIRIFEEITSQNYFISL